MRTGMFGCWLVVAVLGASVLTVSSVAAQSLKFEHLTVDDGLSQGSVECVVQDSVGFIWICTRDGLNRYDGRGIKVFKHDRADGTSISNNFVRQMIPGQDGQYWLATKFGLNRFDLATESFLSFQHDPDDSTTLSSDNIMRVLEDHAGTLWVGTWGGGLNSRARDGQAFRHYSRELDDAQFARGNIINALCETRDHTLWVAAITGLYASPPDRSEFVRHDLADETYDGSRDNIVVGIYEDEEGILWLGTYTGLIRYDPRTRARQRFPLDPADPKNTTANLVRFITSAPDPESRKLWICTASQGLVVFDPDTFEMTMHQHNSADSRSIAHNALWSAFQDRGGSMWIGTAGRGVEKITPMSSRFEHINQESVRDAGLNSNSIWSFCEDRAGNLWLGTSRGLVLHDSRTGQWRSVTHDAGQDRSLGDGEVYSMLSDRSGDMWFATGSAGLSRLPGPDADGSYAGFEFEHFRSDSADTTSLSANRLFSLLEDRTGRIWVGTVDEGVDVFTPGQAGFKHYRPNQDRPNSISDNGVECLYQDAAGLFWFGTLAGGLNRLDAGTGEFRHYQYDAADPRSLSNNHVTSILQDDQGILWVATADGLNRMDPGRDDFGHYFEAEGLPNSYIYGLLPDGEGHLWLSTNYGLSRFDPATESFRNFTTRDGLQGNEFNAGAFYRSPSGQLYFGGHNGFNRFDTTGIQNNPTPPPVALTRFQILGRPVQLPRAIYAAESVTLSPRDYFFSFEFASLDFWAPERNRYQHKMEGLDDDWVDSGTRNFVNYTHLDPGNYVFRVRASNSDGIWNPVGASLSVRIQPPFWRQGWFLALMVLALALAVYGLHRIRVRRLLQIERIRTRLSADLHDEIATNLSSIAMFSGMIESGSDPEHSTYLQVRIRELAEDSVGSIRDIIWAINPTTETLHGLLQRLSDGLVVSCRAKHIDLRSHYPAPDGLPSRNLAPRQRQHLWLLLKEAANNSIKHSGCTILEFQVDYGNGILDITLRDDGVGFDSTLPYEGNGLNTMQMRTKRLAGSLALDSSPGRGTTIQIKVPI